MKYKDRINKRICEFIRSRYAMVDVKPEAGLFNYRCYFNAVEYASLNKNVAVLEAIYIEDGHPTLHYINRNSKGELLETTLGYRAKDLEYYVIREIHKSDYKRICGEFDNSLDSWRHQFTNWFERKIIGIERVL